MRAGVLALQGDVREHARTVEAVGGEAVLVRKAEDIDDIDAIIIPGGESTTIGLLADRFGLLEPLREVISAGLPTLGTCAGMIFLASATTEPRPQVQLGVLDVVVRRNAFGRQDASFEADIEVVGIDGPVRGIFIRAPWIEKHGDDVRVLASVHDHPVMVQQANILATSFHPELVGEGRVHELLMRMAKRPEARGSRPEAGVPGPEARVPSPEARGSRPEAGVSGSEARVPSPEARGSRPEARVPGAGAGAGAPRADGRSR